MHIRLATLDDIRSMIEIEKNALTAAHWSFEQYQSACSELGPKRILLVIEEDSTIQGFLVARAVGQEWEIENVAIAGPARRRRLGACLLRHFLDLVRGQGGVSVFLEVREANRAAQALFEQCGFIESGRRADYYRNPEEDAVTYVLRV
ncbi:MAG TPA: ribosomal protein S18-alanine N-acetyltransferase [Terriglobales bacterium]|nr:ribosomal protein S18-alanine N-acetyltransferase [Terriglobales bacterium]